MLPQSKEKPILFAIARPELGRVFFEEVLLSFLYYLQANVKWVPHVQIILPKSKGSKKTVIDFSKNDLLKPDSFLNWINSSLDLDVPLSYDSSLAPCSNS